MATATRTSKPDPVQPEPVIPETHRFYSRSAGLRLPRVKERLRRDEFGEAGARIYFQDDKGNEITRVTYEFQRGQLEATDGEDNFPDGPGGEWQDKVQWLRRHYEFNRLFHEHGNEPDRPQPTDDVFLDRVNEAALELDVDRIVEMIRVERETHQRPNLLLVADKARKRVLSLKQQLADADPPEAA